MISRFVYKTNNALYHSVLQKELPLDSDEKTLKDNFFLEEQNLQSIKNRLSSPPIFLNLVIIPTWECNLRCSHCCVLDSLKKKDENNIDLNKLEKFLHSYFKKFTNTKRFQGYFLGGESFLYPEKISNQILVMEKIAKYYELKLSIGTTTNLAYNLKINHINCFEKLENIAVSLDGLIENHNKQRHAYTDKTINPYEITILNLKKLVALGFREKLFVQGALNNDILNDEEYIKQYFKSLTKIGIKKENIIIGSIFPTKQKPEPQKAWINYKKNNLFIKSKPCCKYAFMSNIQVNPDNSITDNFYTNENSNLGNLDDDIEKIIEKNYNLIFNHMPALNDKNCLNCKAFGYCWGGCVNGFVHIGNKPSYTCSRETIVPLIQKLADENKLINKGYLKNLL